MINDAYHIRRGWMLAALYLPARIPVGETFVRENVVVRAGRWGDQQPLTLPKVTLAPKGVANRIRVVCPVCKKAEVRFSVLWQHAGSKACLAQKEGK